MMLLNFVVVIDIHICNDWLGVRVAGPNYFGEAFGIKRMLWTRRKFSHYNIE
jgi:hypothetical protein